MCRIVNVSVSLPIPLVVSIAISVKKSFWSSRENFSRWYRDPDIQKIGVPEHLVPHRNLHMGIFHLRLWT
jgi:hypothetical protein